MFIIFVVFEMIGISHILVQFPSVASLFLNLMEISICLFKLKKPLPRYFLAVISC